MEKQTRGYKAHVLVIPFPAQGHINPMLQFSKRLLSKGIKPTFANTVYISKSMHGADAACSIALATISDGYDDGGHAQAESPETYLAKFEEVGSRTLASLIKELVDVGQPVDAVIYDGFLPWALDVAKEFGLVGVAFFTQSCAVNNIYYHVQRGILPVPLSGSPVLVPGLPPLEPWETPSYVHDHGAYPGFVHMVLNQFCNIEKADWVLFTVFYKLEEEVLDWMSKLWRVRAIGPTLPSMYVDKRLQDDKDYGINLFKPHSAACMDWLNQKPPGSVVYVSFGSMADLDSEQMEEVAWGLDQSNYSFLWVVRASEQAKLPKDFEKSEKGLVVAWSPQLEVLSHESMGCFVTHCGLNSVYEALSLGVAMVAVPLWTDQTTNAKYVEDVWGVGIRAGKDEKGVVRREVLEHCLREVMEGERGKRIKENSAKWKRLAIEAVSEGGSSEKNVDELVDFLQNLNTSF
ncbi:UDP-glycosyltransferase 74G1-like [Diospyros lotus]|uniref:UDP-glycosyltransferase 74G1-like n=1 Tax=Diospyros lotus TaxID=55363 RepID=UPI00224E5E87|nr:UDP-glycosyltransferase 74G1-like [Diospyros lotus]